MKADEIKDKIIEIYEKLLKIDGDIIIVNSSLSYLKSQLSEAGEEKPIIKKCRQCRFFDLDEHCEPCESCYPIAYSNWQPR
jgi:recombinational DNA repair protein RecR